MLERDVRCRPSAGRFRRGRSSIQRRGLSVEWYEAGALMLGTVLVLMAIGLPVALAFVAANMVGVFVFMGGFIGIEQLIDNASDSLSIFLLVTVPLFIMMGNLFFHTGLAVPVFDALDALFGRIPGRLSYVTISGGTVFAALSGSSMANTAMMGSLMVPEMTKRGYKRHMSIGPVMGSGGLAILIPPSALAVLLGSLAEINVGALLIAGVLPGLVLAAFYASLIYAQVKIDPTAAPSYDAPSLSWGSRIRLVAVNVMPMSLVIFFVIGFIILGIATPTESAAFGVLGTLILAAVYRRLSWTVIYKSLEGSLKVTVMVLFIILGSLTFSQVFAFSGATGGFINWATDFELPPIVVVLAMFGVLLVFGMFVDAVSMLLITLPVFMPLAIAVGYDPIWFGIIMLLAIEMSATTPPFGLLLYVMLGVAPRGTTFPQVVRAGFPFLLCDAILFALLLLFPGLALYLPSLIRV